ncbi:hypothetical protein POW35_23415, partial [Escherichia coli]
SALKTTHWTLTTAEHRRLRAAFLHPRHHALTRSPLYKTPRRHTNAPAHNLNAITTRSDNHHHRQRAVLSPPRPPASWGGFNAVA